MTNHPDGTACEIRFAQTFGDEGHDDGAVTEAEALTPPNVLTTEEAIAIVSAAFGEDHAAGTLDAVLKRLGDWVDASLDLSPPATSKKGTNHA